jgi:G3E family GTPase
MCMMVARCRAFKFQINLAVKSSCVTLLKYGPWRNSGQAAQLIRSTQDSRHMQRKPCNFSEDRMRMAVLGGLLGSGKTTWLRHQLHEGVFNGAFVIVNEAVETPVDDALLQGSSELAVLAGGCACCVGKADLIALLRKICDDRSKQTEDRFERIVLETSDLADPGPIVEAIRTDPILVHHIIVRETLVMVDASYSLSQLRSEPLGRKQIEIADCMMVSTIDEANPDVLARLLATLHVINPGA